MRLPSRRSWGYLLLVGLILVLACTAPKNRPKSPPPPGGETTPTPASGGPKSPPPEPGPGQSASGQRSPVKTTPPLPSGEEAKDPAPGTQERVDQRGTTATDDAASGHGTTADTDEANTGTQATGKRTADAPAKRGPLRVRIGLATDLDELRLPCCDPTLRLIGPGLALGLEQALLIQPGGQLTDRAIYRLQVAALKDEKQAAGLARRLAEATGEPADSVFDAGTDLYKVRFGRYLDRAGAERGRGRLEALGVADAWIATEGGELREAAFTVRQGERSWHVPGRWLVLQAQDGRSVQLGKRGRYRDRVLVFLNPRGRLNLINELDIEDYLRGVVPKEMGPELYNRIEALKAQAVAARTFTVRNLGGFADEGYDLCSTPRCQVYGGSAVEHPVSDRAVRETSGEVVLLNNEPAETFYSATCGGHTEDVAVVFPLKSGEHLRGVPCLEAGEQSLAGRGRGATFPAGLIQTMLPPSAGPPYRVMGARLEHLALLAGLPVPKDQLNSLGRRELRRYLGSVFDLALDPRLLSAEGKLRRLLDRPPSNWGSREQDLGQYLLSSGLASKPHDRQLDRSESDDLLVRLAYYLGVLTPLDAHFLSLDRGTLTLRSGGQILAYTLEDEVMTFRGDAGGLRGRSLSLLAGDPIRILLHQDRVAAVIQNYEPVPVELGRRRQVGRWSRFRSTAELRRVVGSRYPGFSFQGFEILSRGVSGRVGKLRLLGDDARTLLLEGLPVRWTLDLPDTRFTAERRQGPEGQTGWLFRGSGWGHGVGMCQAGTYGMAVRGASYREILSHYYRGIEVGSPDLRQLRPENSWPPLPSLAEVPRHTQALRASP